ncbi:Asparagine synthase [Salegentibacter echinorum]|uniref:asparagine synthase (glutamine-hydrolyzing) n=1 Tax=Salegentibacter echinorum TaxID=1073325 RepID=A0A1M5FGY9_SALEC|nr:asparagine synthase-related protein [Salegentibacter echinorum]SHF90756.1 Asparagine synthase [Salegentibacter echinorum]
MSKILYVLTREEINVEVSKKKLQNISKRISPNNISSKKPVIYSEKQLIYSIINPTKTIISNRGNVLLGGLFKEKDWEDFDATNYDGNYSIFRINTKELQILTDVLGTRTVWYYKNDKIFIAATSQRAIVQYLGDFEFNEAAIPWMISSGSLGPEEAWDKRIRKLPADGILRLDRKSWELNINRKPVIFNATKSSKQRLKKKLQKSLTETFQSLSLDFSNWAISLSGGYDSRAIINLLTLNRPKTQNLKTVTWGASEYLKEKDSDASIAKRIAKTLALNHSFYDTSTNTSSKNFKNIIELFLLNGEGRNDHIPAYMDGFKIWKTLYENEVQGVVRGDEVFGYNKIYSAITVKDFIGITLCSDFSNLSKYRYITKLKQKLPREYLRLESESLNTWKDRLFHLHRIPTVQASLADLKYGFVEQINPFLSREIVYQVRDLPDNLRRDKKLFREIVEPLGPRIPYSNPTASQTPFVQLLRREDIVAEIKRGLNSKNAELIFPKNFLDEILGNMKSSNNKALKTTSPLSKFKNLIPSSIKKRIAQRNDSLIMDDNLLAFRIYIIINMNKILENDASVFKS